jgi:exo-beta-1,3-glucanase (GH17 family)/cellulose synthase/poly-beta-1,6-N-acetylglucosamine synthase-like glycosyltransferase
MLRANILRANIIIAVTVAILTVCVWAFMNQPEQEPAWPKRIQGFSFQPMHAGEDPVKKQYPSTAEIDADLALLSGKTNAVRTYSVESTLAKVPELAKRHGINVALGGWISKDMQRNETEIKTLIETARTNTNVVRVIVGNEAILRGDVSVAQMAAYLDRVRKRVWVPVSTAEPWHVWVKHPELAEHVDYLAVHMLPYWEGKAVDAAVGYIVRRINELKARFPGKPIVIAEVGWPSNGRTRYSAVASVANEAIFLRRFLARAKKEKYTYYIMEAFDQPWKRTTEGAVGAYWGVYDVDRQPKFPFTDPIVAIPNWYLLAGISVLVAVIMLTLLLCDSRTLRRRGRSFLAVIAYMAATAAVLIVYNYIQQYLTVGTVVVGITMFAGMFGVILVLLTEAHEWAEALWVTGRRRPFKAKILPETSLPFVSIHVPAYNEPPRMMIETLDALARLDYLHFEVLVIDNNTKDPLVWRPVAEHCRKLGPRFRFFHVDPLSGFKAGALNYALKETDPQADIIAVIDSDYVVDPAWLKDLVPQFSNERIALVQAPQDYRDDQANLFKAICYSEYQGFFHIGMITRNERNAIIQHGTMTMVRRDVLEEIGGWGEWCITEDAELGLRIFENAYDAIYMPKSYGKGLMPDTFGDYQKQRFRWAYGAIQILRRHIGFLLGRQSGCLTRGQRYHFIAGWLPWIADGMNLVFNCAALAWSAAMIIVPRRADPPLIALSILPLALFTFKFCKIVYLYRTRVRASLAQTVAAVLAGFALSHTIAKAVLLGLVTRNKPFYRTPKLAPRLALLRALIHAKQEVILLLAFLGAAVGVHLRQRNTSSDLDVWIVVMLVQAIPYAAAVVMSLISGFQRMPAEWARLRRSLDDPDHAIDNGRPG